MEINLILIRVKISHEIFLIETNATLHHLFELSCPYLHK